MTFKKGLQEIFMRVGLYHRVKASFLYDLYWLLANRQIVDRRRIEMQFYQNLLQGFQPGDLIIDIGANQGAKTGIFLRLGARVVAVEPDELNQEILRQNFTKYRFIQKPLTIVGKAVSDKIGVETFWIQEPGLAMNTLSQKWVETLQNDESRFGYKFQFPNNRKIETLTLQDLISIYGEPQFVKIDVEGYELNVIRGLRSPIACLSFEVNLPEFRSEGKQCVDHLMNITKNGLFNYTANCAQGFELAEWRNGKEFQSVLDTCKERSIEVFWRTKKSHNITDKKLN